VFGVSQATLDTTLKDSQQVDLMITWEWLKNRVWTLAYMHGLMTEEDESPEFSLAVLFKAAQMACMWCDRYGQRSMDRHGKGFVSRPPRSLLMDLCRPRNFSR
jgi:hypothetical protein